MHAARRLPKPTLAAHVALGLLGALFCIHRSASAETGLASAQPSASQNSTELDQVLFVEVMSIRSGPNAGKDAYTLSWIPAPLQRYCLGKTPQACATMDFCLRTTTPTVSMCRNLGSALTRMPAYPRGMSPRRMLSITLIPPSTMQGFDLLQKLAETMPQSSPQVFSMAARVKARVRLTPRPDDDDLTILEILSSAPF